MMRQAFVAVSTILTCLTAAVIGDVAVCHIGEILQVLPMFLEGENISLTCIKNGAVDSGLKFVRNKEDVEDKHITKLNGTAIAMVLPPLTKEELDQVGLMMNYDCRDGPTCVRNVHVEVEYQPMAVQDVTCHAYNWQRLECSWSLGVKYKQPDNMHVMLEYYWYNSDIQDRSELNRLAATDDWQNCTHMLGKTGCKWDGDAYYQSRRIYVRIRVLNGKRNISAKKPISSFLLNEINEPASVVIKSVERYNDTCIRVIWRPENSARILRYNLTYFSSCDTSKSFIVKMRKAMAKNQKRYLCDLVPNSLYNISINTQYAEEKPMGYWSKPTSVLYTAPKKIPVKCPDVVPGLYDQVDETDRNLTIYWQPLHPCEMNSNASQVSYIVTSDIQLKMQAADTYNTQMSVSRLPANITLRAQNDKGLAPSDVMVTVYPRNLAPTPSELIVEYSTVNGKGPVLLTVEPVDQHDEDITNITHTIVWCKGHDFCLEPVRWRDIEGSNTTEHVTDLTRFGLITHGYRGNQSLYTGIVWQKCVYELGKSLAKPVLGAMDSQPVEGFRVDWQPQDCKGNTGYIKYYLVEYCKTDKEESHYCPGVWTRAKVSKHNTSFVKSDLTVDSHYVIRLTSVGKDGPESGVTSDMVTVTIQGMKVKGWWIAVGVLTGLLALVLLGLTVCWIIRCRNNLENKTAVEILNIDDPGGMEMQGENSESPEKGPLLERDNTDGYSEPFTDSGHSSLNSNITDDSKETDRLLAPNHVYFSIDPSNQPREMDIEGQEALTSYALGSQFSTGTTISIYNEINDNYGNLDTNEADIQPENDETSEEVEGNGDREQIENGEEEVGEMGEIFGDEKEDSIDFEDGNNHVSGNIEPEIEESNEAVVGIEVGTDNSIHPEDQSCASNDNCDKELGIDNENLWTKLTKSNLSHSNEHIENSKEPFTINSDTNTTDTDTDPAPSKRHDQEHCSEDLPDHDQDIFVSPTNIDLPDDYDKFMCTTTIVSTNEQFDGHGSHVSISNFSDQLDGYHGQGEVIDIDELDSESESELNSELDTDRALSDTLDGYRRGSDLNLSEISVDDSEDLDDSDTSIADVETYQEESSKVEVEESVNTSMGHDISNGPEDVIYEEQGPVDGNFKFKPCELGRTEGGKLGLNSFDNGKSEFISELTKKKDAVKVKTAGQSSGDYHMATVDSCGLNDCDVTTVC